MEDIFRSIDWLGLDYDEGPRGPDDLDATYSQRHRLDLYHDKLNQLRDDNRLFGCHCSRTSILRDGTDGLHPSSCRERRIELTEAETAWRIHTRSDSRIKWRDADGSRHQIALHESMRDFVVRKKNQIPAYQIASLSDDMHFDINLVVRGRDLLDSTAAQRWLGGQVHDGDSFLNASFVHHPIVTNDCGEKLSKSSGATSLRSLRVSYKTPSTLYRRLSPLLGLSEPIDTAEEALAAWTP